MSGQPLQTVEACFWPNQFRTEIEAQLLLSRHCRFPLPRFRHTQFHCYRYPTNHLLSFFRMVIAYGYPTPLCFEEVPQTCGVQARLTGRSGGPFDLLDPDF